LFVKITLQESKDWGGEELGASFAREIEQASKASPSLHVKTAAQSAPGRTLCEAAGTPQSCGRIKSGLDWSHDVEAGAKQARSVKAP
jgi:hypothetical protein